MVQWWLIMANANEANLPGIIIDLLPQIGHKK
jgi:hypothetical protein